MALSNNALEVYNIPQPAKTKEEPPEAARIYSLDLPGHRTDVRTLCLSADDTLLASASNGTIIMFFTQYYQRFFTPDYIHRHAQGLELENDILYPYHRLRSCNMQHIPPWRPPCKLLCPHACDLLAKSLSTSNRY